MVYLSRTIRQYVNCLQSFVQACGVEPDATPVDLLKTVQGPSSDRFSHSNLQT